MTYIIDGDTLKWVLDKVDEAISILEPFKAKHNSYSYSISIFRNRRRWKAKIEVKYGKKDRDSSQEFISSSEIF